MKYKNSELETILPHRAPMLLVDDIELVEIKDEHGNTIKQSIAHYTVKGDEFFLQGHFPGNPVVPGVILCEMMAQSCCVLCNDVADVHTFLTGLDNVKFKQPVRPGDTIRFETRLNRTNRMFRFCSGRGFVNEKLCVSAEFSFALVPK